MTIALYLRISDDHRAGRGEGVKTQERWGRDYAAKTWPSEPIAVYCDNDLSASDPDVIRPDFERLREAVRAGELTHLWTVEQTRLERIESRWFTFAAELEVAGIHEVHTRRDGIVRPGDVTAGVLAVIAAAESRRTKKRIRDRLDVLAAEGRPSGGRTFGYTTGVDEHGRKSLVLVNEEAAVVRQTADRILAGWSLTRIGEDLAARGIVGVHRRKIRDEDGYVVGYTDPKPMTTTAIRSMVTNMTVVGRRLHKGQVIQATWTPILEVDVWDAVRDELSAPRMIVTSNGHTALAGTRRIKRKYLLSETPLTCGLCAVGLVGSLRKISSTGELKVMYWCSPKRTRADGVKGCGRIGILAAAVDEYVTSTLFAELDKPAFAEALAADPYTERREALSLALRAIEGKRRTLAAEWSADALTSDEWKVARAELAERERELRAERAQIPKPVRRHDVDVLRALRAAWPAMTSEEQRAIVLDFIGEIKVYPARRGGSRAQPVAERLSHRDTWWRR